MRQVTLSSGRRTNTLVEATPWPFPLDATPEHTAPAARRTTGQPRAAVKKSPKPAELDTSPWPWPTAAQFDTPLWPEVTHTTTTRLKYQIGIELAMMPQVLKGDDEDNNWRFVNDYAKIMSRLLGVARIPHNDCGRDQMAVEVSSKILTTWGGVKKFYDKVSDCMLKAGLVPHIKEYISGGGHIHVGKVPVKLMAAMLRDLQNRPWLNWVFNDPDDSISSHSYAGELEEINAQLKRAAAEATYNPALFSNSMSSAGRAALLFYGKYDYITKDWLPDDKGKMARHCDNYDTFEFRFFQAPCDWAEQEAHLRFVEAYMAWVAKTYADKPPEVRIDSLEKVDAMDEVWCRNQFISFLHTLGLPLEPYQRMLDDNLPDRFKRGVRK